MWYPPLSPGTRRVIVGAKNLSVGTGVALVKAPLEIEVEQCVWSCDQLYIPVSDSTDQWQTENGMSTNITVSFLSLSCMVCVDADLLYSSNGLGVVCEGRGASLAGVAA
jgi:hypothetical protein